MANNGYIGKIGNSGTQVVQAPISNTQKGNGAVRKGEDLRGGK